MGKRTNLVSYLAEFASAGAETAYVYPRGLRTYRLSYPALAEAAWRTARWLREGEGLAAAERVVLWGGNSGEWAASFWGCLAAGVVAVPVDAQASPAYVARIVEETEAKLILADAANLRTHLFEADGMRARLREMDTLQETVRNYETKPFDAAEITRDTLAQILYTSGSTASPKGVCLTHGNILASLEPLEQEIGRYLRWERWFHPLRFLVQLPLSHVFGQMMGLFIPPLLRAEMHFSGELNPADVLDSVRRRKISVIAAAPRYLDVLAAELQRQSEKRWGVKRFAERLLRANSAGVSTRWWLFRDIHRRLGWKFWAFICGGASLPERTERLCRGMGFAVIQGYGMTETASLVSVNHPFKMSRGSIGKSMPGREVRIGDDGEVLVRGQNVSPGYWTKEGIVPLAKEKEWFATGDLATVDASGNMYFRGRSKDLIVTGSGMNIVPEDVEEALRREPPIRDAVVVPVDGPSGTEAFAMLLASDATRPSELKTAVESANSRLEAYQRVARWAVWPGLDFPRTATRKIRRADVAQVAQAMASGRETVAHVDALEEALSSSGARWKGDLSDGMQLGTDLGLDSLGRIQALAALEARFETRLDEAAFTETTTVADLRAMLGTALDRITEGSGPEAEVSADAEVVAPGSARDTALPATPSAASAIPEAQYPFAEWPFRRWASAFRQVFHALAMRPLTRVWSGWARRDGIGQLREVREPALFVANHVTAVDGALLMDRLPWRFGRKLAIAMSGEMLRGYRHPATDERWYWRLWLPVQYLLVVLVYAVFPLPRTSGFRRAFDQAGRLADKGYSILVFPEGRRSQTGEIQHFEHGIGILARDLHLPVIPVRVHGLVELREAGRHFARPGDLSIHLGKALHFDSRMDAVEIAEQLENSVRALS